MYVLSPLLVVVRTYVRQKKRSKLSHLSSPVLVDTRTYVKKKKEANCLTSDLFSSYYPLVCTYVRAYVKKEINEMSHRSSPFLVIIRTYVKKERKKKNVTPPFLVVIRTYVKKKR